MNGNKLDLDHIKAITPIIDGNEINYLSKRIDFNMHIFVNEYNAKFGIKNVWSIGITLDHVYINCYDDYASSYKGVMKIRNKSLYEYVRF